MQSPDAISAAKERLSTEIDLLKAMYDPSVVFNPSVSEVSFTSPEHLGARLVLRLPGGYPGSGQPIVISACDSRKNDMRREVTDFLKCVGSEEGEVLDLIFQAFTDLLRNQPCEPTINENESQHVDPAPASKTVIIWLHHLLATSKRKLALHPSASPDLVSGITKPGYPGVLLFTGPRQAVDQHVAELKSQNWQAFQVRYDQDGQWTLASEHGRRIMEVETMADVVQRIQRDHRDIFLKAIGVK